MFRCAAFLSVALVFSGTHSADCQAPKPGIAAYLDGLQALEAGKWNDAAASITRAIQAEDENASYYTARGVAYTLAEKFTPAISDFTRSLKLRPDHIETRLWLAAAYRMADNPRQGALTYTYGKDAYGNDVPHDYASFVYNDMAMEYWQKVVNGNGKSGREKFGRAGAMFAQRARGGAGPAVANALLAKARDAFAKREFAAAFRDLETLRATHGDDFEFLSMHGSCCVAMGDLETARHELTRALTLKPDQAGLYMVRAFACARLGCWQNAKADLDLANRFDPKATLVFKTQAKKFLTPPPGPAQDPVPLLDKLVQSARKDDAWSSLVDQAVAVHKAVNRKRRFYDMYFQDQFRRYEEAGRANPKDADRLAEFAWFLYQEAVVKTERVEPRGPARPYRHQTAKMQQAELQGAVMLCDKALEFQPEHQRALVTKAAILTWQLRFDEARLPLLRFLKLGVVSDPVLARQVVWMLEADAARRKAFANEIRRSRIVKQETTEEYEITFWRIATPAEVKFAEAVDRQADEIVRLALKYLEGTAKAHAGTAAGDVCQAVIFRRRKDMQAAKASLEQAIRRQPDLVEAYFILAATCADLGLADEAVAARAAGLNIRQTTAAPRLSQAWTHITHTRFTSARKALQAAQALDAADARSLAYLAIIADNPDDALAHFGAALALEEARTRLAENSFAGGDKPLLPENIGLTVALRMQRGQLLLQQKKAATALEDFRTILALRKRVQARNQSVRVYSALLPNPNREATDIPEANHLAAHFTWAMLRQAQSLAALGRHADAEREFIAVVKSVDFSELGTSLNLAGMEHPKAWAALALARSALARRDHTAARQWLNLAGAANWGPPDLRAERQQVETLFSKSR